MSGSPTQFELDMSMLGKKIGDPIPKGLKSRPEPGAYGGIYDDKPVVVGQFEQHKTSEPAPAEEKSGYKTRDQKPEDRLPLSKKMP